MRILLAIDNSPLSESAVQAVVEQFRRENAEIKVISIVEQLDVFGYPAGAQYDHLHRAQTLVDAASETLRAAGFHVESAVMKGEAREGIVDVAQDWHADVIVLGSHGRSGLRRFLLGSVSSAVVHHAPCSVHVVRSPRR